MLIGLSSIAQSEPAANKSESPGKNGRTTKPVSQKTTSKRMV
jgi:hypothetical protein